MFIHIGGTTVIRTREIVAIFSVDIEAASPVTAAYLRNVREAGRVHVIDANETKSIVVTKDRVYYSPISALTLKRRSHDTAQTQPLNTNE